MNDKRKVMYRLAYHYLKVAQIELEDGEVYDANKLAKGLSLLYKECQKNEEEVKRRITIAGEYFNSKGLSWTPQAVWRDWELIRQWIKKDRPQEQDVSQRRKL